MNLEQYNIEVTEDFLEYSFYSEGPKGAIKKVVRFTKVSTTAFTYYNLGFGDWNEKTNTIDDFINTNNQDAEKVLATVAAHQSAEIWVYVKKNPCTFFRFIKRQQINPQRSKIRAWRLNLILSITIQGKIKEIGKEEKQKLPEVGIEQNMYEGKVEFVQTLLLKAAVKTTLTGTITYQACTEEKCLPVKTEPFTVQIN